MWVEGGSGTIFWRNLAGKVTGGVAFGCPVLLCMLCNRPVRVFSQFRQHTVEFRPRTFTNAFGMKNCTYLVPRKFENEAICERKGQNMILAAL